MPHSPAPSQLNISFFGYKKNFNSSNGFNYVGTRSLDREEDGVKCKGKEGKWIEVETNSGNKNSCEGSECEESKHAVPHLLGAVRSESP